jgi:hypothetical protein
VSGDNADAFRSPIWFDIDDRTAAGNVGRSESTKHHVP